MKKIFFDYILIADMQEEKAVKKTFVQGINIVTSKENHVGKSSLLKSLYYTLGTEVHFDDTWGKSSKLFIVGLLIDNVRIYIARYNDKYSILDQELKIITITDKVGGELSKTLADIFGFEIYLPEKEDGKSVLAPPVFTFLPYYIDQDRGWGNEPFASFLRLDQFRKDKRLDSLYYHFGVYNKATIEKRSTIDANKETIKTIMTKYEEQKNTLAILETQSGYVYPTDSVVELENALAASKDSLEVRIKTISKLRDKIHKLESERLQYVDQLDVITKYNKIKEKNLQNESVANEKFVLSHECPQCGCIFEDEIYKIVRQQYSIKNEEFVINQITYLINEIDQKLESVKNEYLQESSALKEEEDKVSTQEISFNDYIKSRGLRDTLSSVHSRIGQLMVEKDDLEKQNKAIEKELRKNPGKKDVENNYKDFVKESLIDLKAWDERYDSKIKITKPLGGQGTLSSKIILADYIAVFKTLDKLEVQTPRFSFVIDSPRTKEPSKTSSKDILSLIIGLSTVPQIILATMDFDDFKDDFKGTSFHTIELTDKKALLNSNAYSENQKMIGLFKSLLVK
ncbi:hypothetical protein SPSIL_052370 [Sporomusa silvacetica DSM 10669]|uniref:Chromosome partition protein Smc n=1 Tax=Sporomusa silvacetica DSM 10669 TaxID=1123289 RepID=A0ABZ3ITG7_9FIRM|nr:hypothetical protein [Sporomusa silvacetica]OZC19672.1 hypothetical protein SPSIL_21020 [Sporomusa silvacetica DSM 10669]